MGNLRAELFLNSQQAFVGDRVPSVVVDRAGDQQAHLELAGGGWRVADRGFMASSDKSDRKNHCAFHRRDFTHPPPATRHPPLRDKPAPSRRGEMDDIERTDDGPEDDEQFEQMIIENSILLHSLAALLVRKGVLKQEELDDEMDKLYEEMEKFDEE